MRIDPCAWPTHSPRAKNWATRLGTPSASSFARMPRLEALAHTGRQAIFRGLRRLTAAAASRCAHCCWFWSQLCIFLALIGAPHAISIWALSYTGVDRILPLGDCAALRWCCGRRSGSPSCTPGLRVCCLSAMNVLPTYSVLVPLFGEANMVPQLLDGTLRTRLPRGTPRYQTHSGRGRCAKPLRQYGSQRTNYPAVLKLSWCHLAGLKPKPKALNYRATFCER